MSLLSEVQVSLNTCIEAIRETFFDSGAVLEATTIAEDLVDTSKASAPPKKQRRRLRGGYGGGDYVYSDSDDDLPTLVVQRRQTTLSRPTDRHRAKRRDKQPESPSLGMQLRPPLPLREVINEAPIEIEKERRRGISRFGTAFEEGDAIAITTLQNINTELQTNLLEKLRNLIKGDASVTESIHLIDTADLGRDRTISTLIDLKARILQGLPPVEPVKSFTSPSELTFPTTEHSLPAATTRSTDFTHDVSDLEVTGLKEGNIPQDQRKKRTLHRIRENSLSKSRDEEDFVPRPPRDVGKRHVSSSVTSHKYSVTASGASPAWGRHIIKHPSFGYREVEDDPDDIWGTSANATKPTQLPEAIQSSPLFRIKSRELYSWEASGREEPNRKDEIEVHQRTTQNVFTDAPDTSAKDHTGNAAFSRGSDGHSVGRLASLAGQCHHALQDCEHSNIANAREQSHSWLATFDACAAAIGVSAAGKEFSYLLRRQKQVVVDVLAELLELLHLFVEPDSWEPDLPHGSPSSPTMSYTSWSTDSSGPESEKSQIGLLPNVQTESTPQSESLSPIIDPELEPDPLISQQIHAGVISRTIDDLMDRLIDMSESLARHAQTSYLNVYPIKDSGDQYAEFRRKMHDMLQHDELHLRPEQTLLLDANVIRRERFDLASIDITSSLDNVAPEILLPYTCPMINCSSSIAMFAHQKDWTTHLERDHALPSHWECVVCGFLPFCEVDFEEHIRSEHSATITECQISDMLELSQQYDVVDLPESCPLCLTARDDVSDYAYTDHLAGCIHAFSLLSLPWQADEHAPQSHLTPASSPPEPSREITKEIKILKSRKESQPLPRKDDRMRTEVAKDMVIREAIDEQGYEYEETDSHFYILEYLRYEDILRLVEITEDIKRERRERIQEIQWERDGIEREIESLPRIRRPDFVGSELQGNTPNAGTPALKDQFDPAIPVRDFVEHDSHDTQAIFSTGRDGRDRPQTVQNKQRSWHKSTKGNEEIVHDGNVGSPGPPARSIIRWESKALRKRETENDLSGDAFSEFLK